MAFSRSSTDSSSDSEINTEISSSNGCNNSDTDPVWKRYPFTTQPVPRLDIADPEINIHIAETRPVIITNSKLVEPALKWNLDYLQENLGNGTFNVLVSKNDRFMYYDTRKVQRTKGFHTDVKFEEMKFNDFVRRLHRARKGDNVYLQQALNDTVGKKIVDDFVRFNWTWVTDQQKRHGWGPLTSNLLLIAPQGSITPAHYDEQENFFAQVHGQKRILLFSPDQFGCMYPYPVDHPHDRQSQNTARSTALIGARRVDLYLKVNFDVPDYERFPKFKDVKAAEGFVNPGDILYIPMHWWHHIESHPSQGETTSVTFWYKTGTLPKQIPYPLSSQQKVSIMRNIEKMLSECLRNPDEIPYPLSSQQKVSIVRNIEKMLSECLHNPDEIPYPLSSQQKVSIVRNIEKMLSECLHNPDEIGPLLHMMMDGRYSNTHNIMPPI